MAVGQVVGIEAGAKQLCGSPIPKCTTLLRGAGPGQHVRLSETVVSGASFRQFCRDSRDTASIQGHFEKIS